MVEDSFSFADWAKSCTKHGNEIMCSLDVTSLFANVPLDETIHICLDKLYFLPVAPKLLRSFTEFIIGNLPLTRTILYLIAISTTWSSHCFTFRLVLLSIVMCHFEER